MARPLEGPNEAGYPAVQGKCPSCGSESLFLGSGGYVTCGVVGQCKNPAAASDILADGEIHHIVEIGETGFNVQHPLIERVDGMLLECGLHKRLSEHDGPPMMPGRYRVRKTDNGYHYEALAA